MTVRILSLRRHYPDQVMRVEDYLSSSQPSTTGSPFIYLIALSIVEIDQIVKFYSQALRMFPHCY
jgi:hypothetical protein